MHVSLGPGLCLGPNAGHGLHRTHQSKVEKSEVLTKLVRYAVVVNLLLIILYVHPTYIFMEADISKKPSGFYCFNVVTLHTFLML